MKLFTKTLAIILALAIMLETGLTALAKTTSKSKYTGYTYTHQTRFDDRTIVNGIDVSQHNGDIDFKKVAADGINYAFVRIGYTGYTKSKFSMNYDYNYNTYLTDAAANGLEVGAYWYSQAITVNEAVAEAESVLKVIDGYDISLPIIFDYEFAGTSSGRLDSANLSKRKMTDIALAFLETIEEAGYKAGIYASKCFYTDNLYPSEFENKYTVWLAHYNTETDYNGEFIYWQYSSRGKVNGIGGNVDMNFYYYDDSLQIPDQSYTGFEIKPVPEVRSKGVKLTKNKDYTLTYRNNIEIGNATVTATGIGDYKGFVKEYTFRIVLGTITGLKIEKATDTTLTAAWNAVEGAKYYSVRVWNKTVDETPVILTADTPKLKITGLKAGYKYDISISAVALINGEEYASEYSDGIIGTTTGASIANLTVKKATTSYVKLSWSKAGTCEAYAVYVYDTAKKKYNKIGETESKSYKAENLSPGKTYAFRVAAISGGKTGKMSSKVKTVTKPVKAKIKSTVSKKSKRINLKWNKQTCTGYQIEWSTTKDFSSNCKYSTVSKSKKEIIVKTKRAKQKYYIRIRAYKDFGKTRYYGNWSKAKAVKVK